MGWRLPTRPLDLGEVGKKVQDGKTYTCLITPLENGVITWACVW